MKPLQTTRIGRRLLRRLSVFSLLLVLLLTAIETVLLYREGLDSFDKTLALITQTQIKGISRAVWDFSTDQLRPQLEGILNFPHVVSAVVYAENQYFLEVGQRKEDNYFEWEIPLVYRTRDTDRLLGSLIIQADSSNLLTDAMRKALVSMVFQAALVGALALILFLLFESMVSKHLSTMADYFRSFELGSGANRLSLGRKHRYNDELDQLADSVNTMREQLGISLKSLGENEQLLENVLNTVPQSIFWKDRNSVYLGCNYAFARDAGLRNSSQVVGKTDFDLPWQAKESRSYRQDDEYVMSHKQPKRHIVESQNRSDGTQVWLDTTKLPMLDESGQVTGVLGVYEDITDRKHAQEELVSVKEAAEAASRAKSEFLANMSHEVRTPLNGLLGMLQLLGMSSLDEKQAAYLAAAIDSSRRLTRLLSDILDLSRIEAGKLVVEESEFRMSAIRDSVMGLFAEVAQQKGLQLSFLVDDELPQLLLGDDNRLRQILFNLVSNSIKFTEKGGVEVEVSFLRRQKDERAWVLFAVTDTGIGIPDDLLRNIFDPFVQAEAAYARRFQGAGLGLSIVSKLVKLMGGTLAIDSAQGVGTSIYVSLPFGVVPVQPVVVPLPEPALEGQVAAGETPLAPLRPLRILLAEDDEVNLLFGVHLLTQAGYAVSTAKDGQQVLEHLAAEDFDLILMDVQMPVMDGVEATKAIRASSELGAKASIPIVAMTAYSMEGDRERFMASGMDDYIAKPVEVVKLAQVIDRVMSKAKAAKG